MHLIDTARLRLRPFTPDDLDAYYTTILSDPDVMHCLPGGVPRPREAGAAAIEHYLASYREHGFGLWAVERRPGGEFIGQAGLMFTPGITPPTVEVAYGFGKPYWGQGYATEAARACLRYGFEQLGLERIIAVFVPGNTASEQVMRKLGMASQGMIAAYGTHLPGYAITWAEFDPGDAPYTVHAADPGR